MTYTSPSPCLSSFPLSSSRTRQLPVPSSICTTLPPLSTQGSYTPRQQPLSAEQIFHGYGGSGDSYFPPSHSNPSSIPSSTASTPAPTSSITRPASPQRRSTRGTATKRTSISSLLSSPDNSSGHDSSAASSPTYHWSGGSSPTTAGTSRSSSVVNTPVNGIPSLTGHCYSPTDYDLSRRDGMYCDQDEDSKMYAVSSPRKKSRGSPRSGVAANDNANRDEYDVLGRKKPKTPRTPMSWDPKDDILLKQLKEEQRLGWKEIATHFRGRTSHACQFRWRRLASGQLKYYQGHRRPPPVTTTAASFANEMASTATAGSISTSPKILMNGLHSVSPTNTTPRQHHVVPHLSPTTESSLPSMHPSMYQPSPQATWGNTSIFQPTPLPSPNSYAPRFLGEDTMSRDNWSEQEDALLLNRKLSFDEVNVLLAGRSEQEIWERQVKLRQNEMNHRPQPCMGEMRRESSGYDERMPGIGNVFR